MANAHHIGVSSEEQPFTHVFIDDASQVSEVNALCAINLGRFLIVVGHPHASSPPTCSALGLRALGDPIINRLSAIYAQSSLVNTHVQHSGRVFVGNSDILRILSPDLLYNNYLKCFDEQGNRSQLLGSKFPVFFFSCDGDDTQVLEECS